MPQLPQKDAYVLARAFTGLPVDDLPVSPLTAMLLDNLSFTDPADLNIVRRILGAEGVAQVFAQDPNAPLPVRQRPSMDVFVPDLPASARLSKQAIQAAESVGGWLDDFTIWATKRSPMTPPHFLQAGGVWSLGVAIARRCYVHLHAPIYPHLYVLWVASTSIFKKTTGMNAINDLIYAAIPHMLMAEEYSPESFVQDLAGKAPDDLETLGQREIELDRLGRKYAAQRGILLDEASSLLGAPKKDYMQGQTEMLMRLYDAPPRYRRKLRSSTAVIKDASLSILGATTPAALARSVKQDAWEDGMLARYALLAPDKPLPYNLGDKDSKSYAPPPALVARLMALHNALPAPDNNDKQKRQAIACAITQDAHAAYAAYTEAVTKSVLEGKNQPDPRLHPNYARLHIQAMKVALSLACMDWADRNAEGVPRITIGHWAEAQQIAETWRASSHRLLTSIDISADSRAQTRMLDYLRRYPEGLTKRELSQKTAISYKLLDPTLKTLLESGDVDEINQKNRSGRRFTLYQIVES